MAAKQEVPPPEEEISLPVPVGDIDLELKGKELGIKYFLVSYSPLNADTRASVVPRRAIRNVQQNGCGIPAAMYFKADGADPEMYLLPDPATLIQLPWKPEYGWLSSDLFMSGKPFAQCPRRCLKRIRRAAQQKGFIMKSGIEPEFTILSRDGSSLGDDLDEQQPMSLQCPLATMRMSPIIMKIYEVMEQLGWEPYEVDHEASCCQYEINFDYAECLQTADRHAFMKFMIKEIAEREGYRVTFMPVPSRKLLCANGLHVNVSLWKDGRNTFIEEDSDLGISSLAKHFIGGLLKHAQGSCVFMCPTVNSYKRLTGGSWCPNTITWGGNNRTVLIRVPANNRVEHRLADGSANPYLIQAAILAAGLSGIEAKIDPPPRLDIQVCDSKDNFPRMPKTLQEAVDALKKDEELLQSLGNEIVEGFCFLKLKEWEKYMWDISDWERSFYLNC